MIAHGAPVEHGLLVVIGVVALVAYGQAWVRQPRATRIRLLAWAGAVVATLLATMPAMERAAERTFTGHMAQHLAMIVIAAPLFVVARPVRTLRHHPWLARTVAPGGRAATTERRVGRWWRRNGTIAAPLLFLIALYLTHLTDVYEWALDHRAVHDLEHVAYLGTAIALWSVVTGTGRRTVDRSGTGIVRTGAARVGTALGVIAGMAVLGLVLMSASEPLVPTYVEALGRDEALTDQRWAASFMWVGGMGMTLPLLVASVWMWASAEERRVRHREAILDAGAPAAHRRGPRPDELSDLSSALVREPD